VFTFFFRFARRTDLSPSLLFQINFEPLERFKEIRFQYDTGKENLEGTIVTQDVGGSTELRWPSGSVIIQ
jgi:hypothetical protein